MKKKNVHLVMFDLDGTLADTGQDLASAVNFTRSTLALEPLPDSSVYSHVGRGIEYLIRRSLPDRGPDHFQNAMRVFLQRYESHLLDSTVLYADVPAVLDYFKNKRRAVVSNKLHHLTMAVLRGLGIEGQFDAVLGGDSAIEKKPDPALLNGVLRRFQISADRAVMVGDGDTDIEAGKRAGVITCGVTYGLGRKEDLVAAGPDIIIDQLGQLSDYFC